MPISNKQSSLNSGDQAGPSWANTEGQATAAGHGQHPRDNADNSNVTMPASKIGPPDEDLRGEKPDIPAGEREVMEAQLDKRGAGWGEQESLTSGLDRKKAEQQGAREAIQAQRSGGVDIDEGAGNRVENEGLEQV
ncbi:Uncharacterized protein BP5553_02982 [Venustampulla echinocandica]|uniref:Uncharacterized protein n=1 Tax=Venustampulla echinocandica TaxID=2656787 RepID=A0A370TSY5_9HELO|nr:Uncharacterized protein BP5553_02982 [Venustampulla echinocandica]RDL38642.1 Uncharacterized protein BP5553_02982 [Venustampulla echinocandica]